MTVHSPQTGPGSPAAAFHLVGEAMGFVYAAALRAATELRIADRLAGGPRTADELAEQAGVQPPQLHRVLRLLATRGVFEADDAGRFRLTPAADALRTDSPVSVHPAVLALTSPLFWQPAQAMDTTLRDGVPAFERHYGARFFDYLAAHPDAGGEFLHGIATFTAVVDRVVVDEYAFPETGTVVDVGGGYGNLLLHVLRSRAGLRGVLFEQPKVLAGHRLAELGAPERWELAEGDFFDRVPAGGDLYLLKFVLHSWSDAECVQILRNCHRALAPGGRVLLIEALVSPGNQPELSRLLDMFMLLGMPGRERTEPEYAKLLAEAGLRLARVVPTTGPVSVVEAAAHERPGQSGPDR